jgi:hypothetical protein
VRLTPLRSLFAVDLRSLALFRAWTGSVLLFDLVTRALDARAFYSDDGLLPRALNLSIMGNSWKVSIFHAAGHPVLVAGLFALAIACAAALTIGWKTPLAVFFSWFFLASIHTRNSMAMHSGDNLLRLLLLWSCFLPLGARASVDAWAGRARGPVPKEICNAGTVLLLMQTCFVYWAAALIKAGDPSWLGGHGVRCSVTIFEMQTPWSAWLLAYPGLMKALSFGVLLFEGLGPLLFFVPVFTGPVRTFAVLGFVVMQLGFGLFLQLWTFPWISTAAVLPFLPSWFWDGPLGQRWATGLEALRRKAAGLARRYFSKASCRPAYVPLPRWAGWAAGLLLVYIFFWNVEHVFYPRRKIPDVLRPPGWFLSVEQKWGMFVPPGRFHDWMVIAGKTRDHTAVDVLNEKRPLSFKKPASVTGFYKSSRWQDFLTGLVQEEDPELFEHMGRYYCWEWNAAHPPPKRLDEVLIYSMQQRFFPRLEKPRANLLHRQTCP